MRNDDKCVLSSPFESARMAFASSTYAPSLSLTPIGIHAPTICRGNPPDTPVRVTERLSFPLFSARQCGIDCSLLWRIWLDDYAPTLNDKNTPTAHKTGETDLQECLQVSADMCDHFRKVLSSRLTNKFRAVQHQDAAATLAARESLFRAGKCAFACTPPSVCVSQLSQEE